MWDSLMNTENAPVNGTYETISVSEGLMESLFWRISPFRLKTPLINTAGAKELPASRPAVERTRFAPVGRCR